jgi:DNA polymerase elongation subunit (family B)
VYAFETEKDLLMSWSYFIKITDPDILTGYNIFGFDYKYLYERSVELGIMV